MNREKYLKVVNWAINRYSNAGKLILSQGLNKSKYSLIEQLAWNKYISPKVKNN